MKVTFTDTFIRALKPPTREQKQALFVEHLEPGLSLVLHISYGGAKTWRVVFYKPGTRKRELPDGSEKIVATKLSASRKLGRYAPGTQQHMSIAEARKAARKFQPPKSALQPGEPSRFSEVADVWLAERVDGRNLRSAREIRRVIEKYCRPHWGTTPIEAIRRSDVNRLLRHIRRHNGPAMANSVLATVSSLMSWWEGQDDDYASPIVGAMFAEQVKRERVLSEFEIAALWACTAEPTPFHGFVRMALMTAQRHAKVLGMRHADIAPDGTWTLAVEDRKREKGTIEAVQLPRQALAEIARMPRLAGNPFVFPGGARQRAVSTASPTSAASTRRWRRGSCASTASPNCRSGRSMISGAPARLSWPRSAAPTDDDLAERVLGHKREGRARRLQPLHAAEDARPRRCKCSPMRSSGSPPHRAMWSGRACRSPRTSFKSACRGGRLKRLGRP